MRKLWLWSSLVSPLWGGYALASRRDVSPAERPKLTAFIKESMELWHVPGLAIAIIDGDEVWAKGFGYSSVSNGTKVTPETLFRMGSTTKSHTAAAMGLVIDQSNGTLSWSTKMKSILGDDDWVLSDAWATDHVTVRDALSHQTGYPRHNLSYAETSRETVRSLRHLEMTEEPRVQWQYSNKMYAAVGYAIEVLTGRHLGHFLKGELWDPLGMDATYFGVGSATASGAHVAIGHVYNNDTGEYVEPPLVETLGIDGAGAVVSNVLDYAKYLQGLMNFATPLSLESQAEIFSAQKVITSGLGPLENSSRVFEDGAIYYGFGWMSHTLEGEIAILHNGAIGSQYSNMYALPQRNFALVVVQNAPGPPQEEIAYKVLYDKLEVPEDKRFDYRGLYEESLERSRVVVDQCIAVWFPGVKPSDDIPGGAPLSAYAGTYENSGYEDTVLTLECDDEPVTTGPDDGTPRSPAHPTKDEDGCFLRAESRRSLIGELGMELQHVANGTAWVAWVYDAGLLEQGYWRPSICVPMGFLMGDTETGRPVGLAIDLALVGDPVITWMRQK